ncbi:single-stranded-DNA-specific exonuclease [Catalinimonas alkaloidigena]|uniref:Single-stranded-DNA-specific exonuclease RecJ n=1 Tax=Catalinimonas alkaloidigena TaxID=1075417 RepID=A0A1G9QAD9_9BACT|nr:single-stranded-DNA-specific exonuclease RecJ [Catalinimonas alkaloidigena]SDM07880.1 single-stranded-DNA-specific exonuclease [Catalinimonas alkaloidigena]
MEKRWSYRPTPSSEQVERLSRAIHVNETLACLLIQRGITTFDDAKDFFRPSLDDLHDPFQMCGMHEAVQRMTVAMQEKREKILIYGDYDVDGTTAVSLVYSFLRNLHPDIDYYIPDRKQEGYGISDQGIAYALERGVTLIITLDCGTKDLEKIKKARRQGIDFIVCDHHEPGDQLPEAVAVLNPKRADCPYPFVELSGCGIGFKLLSAYCVRHGVPLQALYRYLDMLAISIAADIVPITGENRILAHWGMRKMLEDPCLGIRKLLAAAGHFPDERSGQYTLNISNVVFVVAPRLNAAGRMAHARLVVELLTATDEQEAERIANLLELRNTERRDYDTQQTQQAMDMIAEEEDITEETNTTVLYHEAWHKGVVGIMASRCVEKYYRPTVILTKSNGSLTGSARSVDGFDLHAALNECADLLEKFGGHQQAAGLTLSPDKLDQFRLRFEEIVTRRLTPEQKIPLFEIDCELNFADITPKFWRVLKQFAPFGPGNMNPLFVTRQVVDAGCVPVGAKIVPPPHLRFRVQQQDSPVMEGIGFGLAHYYPRIADGEPFQLCYTLEENHFRGQTRLQLQVKDVKFDD